MKQKHLSLKEAIFQIENEPLGVAKTKLATLWPKVRPFVLMLSTIFGFSKKIQAYINAFVAAIDSVAASG